MSYNSKCKKSATRPHWLTVKVFKFNTDLVGLQINTSVGFPCFGGLAELKNKKLTVGAWLLFWLTFNLLLGGFARETKTYVVSCFHALFPLSFIRTVLGLSSAIAILKRSLQTVEQVENKKTHLPACWKLQTHLLWQNLRRSKDLGSSIWGHSYKSLLTRLLIKIGFGFSFGLE